MLRELNPMRRALLLVLAAAVAAAGIVAWQMRREPAAKLPPELANYLYWQAADLADFQLDRAGGRPLGLADLRGKWSLVFFGYTHCPDICPATLAVLADALKRIEQLPASATQVQALFVSVDPQRDTPERLAEYVSYFDPRLVGATGRPEALDALARQLDAPFAIQAAQRGTDGQSYQIAHSATVFLIDPAGRLFARFPPPQSAEEIAGVFQKLRSFHEEGKKSRWAWF